MKTRNLAILLGIGLIVVVILFANRGVFLPTGASSTPQAKAIPLPQVFPRDFPIYPGAAYQGSDEDGELLNGRPFDRGWFETHDAAKKVMQWYDAQLASAGYKPVATQDKKGSRLYSFDGSKGIISMEIFDENVTSYSVEYYLDTKK